MQQEDHEVLTPQEAADYMKISLSTLYRFLDHPDNPIPSYKLSRSIIRIRKSELDAWINKWVKGSTE